MALSDKNLIITPNIGAASDPKIVFSGADSSTAAQNITLTAYPTNGGTLSFDGSTGQLFSVTNSMSGTIFSVNDVSGIPSIEVLDTGLVKIAQYSGNVLLGTGTDTGLAKLQVTGSLSITGNMLYPTNSKSIYGPNTSWSSYLHVGGDGTNGITRTGSIASVVTTNGNLHLDSGSDKGMYLNYYSGTGGIQFGNGATGVTATLTAAGVFNGTNVTVNSNQTLHAGNYTSYSPTLTGGSASGTWGISITGSAGSAGSATSATSATYLNAGNYILRSGSSGSTSVNFNATPAGSKRYQGDDNSVSDQPVGGGWWHYEHMRHSNASNYWGTTVAWGWEDAANKLAVRNIRAGVYEAWVYYLNSGNYNSYAPTLTGGSASGTWGISVTGNAATATTLQTNGAVSFTTDDSGIHVINSEGTSSNLRLGSAWNKPGIYNGSGTTSGGAANSITIGSENSIYFTTQNVERGRFDSSGIGYASASFRAPIFYDSGDTSYYLDPAATPLSLKVAGNIELTIQSASWAEGIRINVPNTSTWGGIRFTRGSSTGNWAIGYTGLNATNDLTIYSGTTNTTQVNLDHSANLSSIGSMRAPIFYDSNDTAYYTDPASTSVMNRIDVVRSDNWLYLDNNYGHSVVGLYNSTVLQGVWAMGDAYKLTAAGAVGNLYGLAWSHPNAGGTAANLNTHGLLVLENGTFLAAVSGSIRARDDMRAPLFYDKDNTAYYLDLNNTSNAQMNCIGDNGWRFLSNRNTTSDSAPLTVYSNNGGGAIMSFHRSGQYAVNFGLDSDNVMRIGGWSASANRWQLDMSGNMYAAGNITAYSSDVRLKENIVTIDNALSKLHKIRGVYYDWKDIVDDLGFNPIDRHDIGVIAQEVREVIPQAIKPAPFDTGCDGKSESGENYITVQMEKIIPLLIEAIKEQQTQFEKQQTEMDELKALVKELLNK